MDENGRGMMRWVYVRKKVRGGWHPLYQPTEKPPSTYPVFLQEVAERAGENNNRLKKAILSSVMVWYVCVCEMVGDASQRDRPFLI